MNEKAVSHISEDQVSLWELFWCYLKIGSSAFGGFMALISVVQSEVVEKKKLLTSEDMLDGISLASILPGPIAVNVVTYTGYRIRGIAGAATCFIAVILPSFLLILGLSYTYFTYGNLPAVNNIFMGFIPTVSAIIIVAALNLSKKSLNNISQYSISLAAMAVLIFIGGFYTTIGIILFSGLLGFILYRNNNDLSPVSDNSRLKKNIEKKPGTAFVTLLLTIPAILAALLKFQTILSVKLLTVFSGMSLMLFGGGFVFIPMIQEIVVDSYGWLTQAQFIDGIALGQVTPGPIVISATFIGYKVAGILGATTATIGAFLPPALLMLFCSSYLQKIKSSNTIQAILKGIHAGVIGMIFAAGYVVTTTAQPNIMSLAIFVAALTLLLRFKVEVILLIPLSGLAGFLYY